MGMIRVESRELVGLHNTISHHMQHCSMETTPCQWMLRKSLIYKGNFDLSYMGVNGEIRPTEHEIPLTLKQELWGEMDV